MSAIMALGAFIPGLFGRKLSDRLTKALGVTLLLLALVALLSLGKCAYDTSVIAKHEAAERARKAEAVAAADRAADEALAAQVAEQTETQNELEAAQTEAVRRDPAGAASPVGPVTESYYDTLRKKKGTKQ